MTRIDNLSNFLTDVADSIREKKGTSEPIKASEFDSEINSIETKIDVDGIIREYNVASGGNVNVNDFVKFVNETEYEDKVEGKRTLDFTGASEKKILAVALSATRVFILHNNNSKNLYGLTCEVVENTITNVTNTLLDSNLSNYSSFFFDVTVLSSNRVFVIYEKNRRCK